METSGEDYPGASFTSQAFEASADLIRHARRGDQAAWEALVRQHQEPVFRLAYLFLGDAHEAEDVAQESFIRAYLALERFDISRPFRPWLLSIAANQARNRRRSLGRFFKTWQKLVQEQPGFAKNERNGEDRRWQSQEIVNAVRRLDHNEQQIIYLRYFLDLSVDETAVALEVAPGTVKSRLHRALNRLRQVIDREHPELKELWE
jgi:RNA polymerase sigma-70 factor (ECF subfamily)